MKMKLMGVLIGIMLITTFIVVAHPSDVNPKKTITDTPESLTYSIDVPIWEIGDEWVYKIDNITIDRSQPGRDIYLYLQLAELPLTVSANDTTTYTLDFETTASGNSIINANLPNGPLNMTITFTNLDLTGSIVIEKSTLGIKTLTADLNGRLQVHIINQPFLPISLPALPCKIEANFVGDFSNSVAMLTFPLNTSMFWNLTATNLTMNGEIRSPWFYVIMFINNIAKLLQNPLLTPEIEALLPVVNLKDALIATMGTNIISIPMIPFAFICNTTETITVAGHTYDTYNISILNGMAHCYYAPTAGSVVKLAGNLQAIFPALKNINMELLSTNYT